MCDWREIRMNVYGINWECVYYVVHVSANVPATPPYIYSPISVRYTLPPSGGADSRPPRVSCRCLAAPYNSLGIQIGGHRRTTDDIYIYIYSFKHNVGRISLLPIILPQPTCSITHAPVPSVPFVTYREHKALRTYSNSYLGYDTEHVSLYFS